MIVVWGFMNSVKEWNANQDNSAASQNAGKLHPKAARLIDMLKNISAENRVNGIVWQTNCAVQVTENIDMRTGVCACWPIYAYCFSNSVAIDPIVRCSPAADVGQHTMGMLPD